MAFVLWNAILSGDIFLLSISCFRLKLTGPAFQTTRLEYWVCIKPQGVALG